jgi:hypothetical protein
MSSADCLILCLEEFDRDLNITKGKVYILHDSNDKYLIRGSKDSESYPFSFICYDYNFESLVDFLEFFIGADGLCNLTIYNHNDLPLTSDEITFNYLHENLDENNIFTAYCLDYLSKRCTTKALKAIKNVCNPFQESENNY